MSFDTPDRFAQALARAGQLARSGEVLQAELLLLELVKAQPRQPDVLQALGLLAERRGDLERAAEWLLQLLAQRVDDLPLALRSARLLWQLSDLPAVRQVLERSLKHASRGDTAAPNAWLALGEVRHAQGDVDGAARAWFQAQTRAAALGRPLDGDGVPAEARLAVERAAAEAARGRRQHLAHAYEALRLEHGAQALARVDAALEGFVAEPRAAPDDARRQPKFLYFPGLPAEPYLDPGLLPWAGRLAAAFDTVRDEALGVLEEGNRLSGFLDLQPGDRLDRYLGGSARQPAWDAFFFYRHGKRYDDNHARCPATSALLDSLELFRVDGQSPEICFSVLAPHTVIKAHYGVSNVRLVLHLPLLVPPGCALNLVDVGEHVWREGELMLFDDTYQHEAWNHSDQTRVVLLMDCWNPHLTPVEQAALKRLIEAAAEFEQAL